MANYGMLSVVTTNDDDVDDEVIWIYACVCVVAVLQFHDVRDDFE